MYNGNDRRYGPGWRYETGYGYDPDPGSVTFGEFMVLGGRWLFDRLKFTVSAMVIFTGLICAGNGVIVPQAIAMAFGGAALLVVALRVPTVKETKKA